MRVSSVIFLLLCSACSPATTRTTASALARPTPSPAQPPKHADKCRTAACPSACEHGNVEACLALAKKLDDKHSVKYLAIGCKADDAESCEEYASALDDLGKTPADHKHAAAIAKQACKLDKPAHCRYWATLLRDGEYVARDPSKAASLFRGACGAGVGIACNDIGMMLSSDSGIPRDEPASVKYFERGCKLHDDTACYDLGTALLTGSGVAPDHKRAVRLMTHACSVWGGYCQTLGEMYANGVAVPEDHEKARTILTRACKVQPETACESLWRLMLRMSPPDAAAAVPHLEQMCEKGGADACESLGRAYTEGKNVAHDPKQAKRFNARACRLADRCGGLASTEHGKKRVALLKRACFKGHDYDACFALGTPEGADEGRQIATPFCTAGDKVACAAISGAKHTAQMAK